MNHQLKYKKYLVPVEAQEDWNDAGHGFKWALARSHNMATSDDDAAEIVKLYDDITKTVADKLKEIDCVAAVTNEFLFTLNLHDDCADLINVEPLNVH